MALRIFIAFIILAAIVTGIMTIVWHEQVIRLIIFRDFFDVSLPILGFGALIKYLCSCRTSCSCSCGCANCTCKK